MAQSVHQQQTSQSTAPLTTGLVQQVKFQDKEDWESNSVENSIPHESRYRANLVAVPIQKKAGIPKTATSKDFQQPNQTGLPDNLKAGLERLSRLDMSNVRVHYNSSRPAQLNALAYAQGTDIYLRPNQEKHLPHEGWHVVQQLERRVKKTKLLSSAVPVNDDSALEKEADIMGAKAQQAVRNEYRGRGDKGEEGDSVNDASMKKIATVGKAEPPRNRGNHIGNIIQMEDFPEDSTGSLDKCKVKTGEEEIGGTALQSKILEMAQEFGTEGGGYRLGTYILFNPKEVELRRADDVGIEEHGMPELPPEADKKALDKYIIPYILIPLHASGQMKYIEKNWAKINRTHDVVIDVDCQFDRRGRIVFHKDSRGTTVFVNLTFTNEEKMRGPEYYEDLKGDPGMEELLPTEVQSDIGSRRIAMRHDTSAIKSPTLDPHGMISFSDPNLYHTTPLMGSRQDSTATKEEMNEFIAKYHADYFSTNRAFFETSSAEDIRRYYQEIRSLVYAGHGKEKRSRRRAESLSEMSEATKSRPRAMSTDLSDKKVTPEDLKQMEDTPRTFIRTWVRFVPRT